MAEFSMSKRRKIETLQSLVEQCKIEEIKSMVRQAKNPLNLIDFLGNTLLHWAARYNNTEIIRFLLESDHNVNARNSSGTTPLLIAAEHCNFDAVKILLNNAANVFARNSADDSVLSLLWNEKDIVPIDVSELLFQSMRSSGCREDIIADEFLKANCDLELVVYYRDARVTEEYLKNFEMIGLEESECAMDFAMTSMDLDNVRILLHCGSRREERVMQFFQNLLDCKSDLIYFECYVRFLDYWNIIDRDKLDYLHSMFISKDSDGLRVLLHHRIDEVVKRKFGIDLLAGIFSNRHVDAIELLKNYKFDVNCQGFGKLSGLHYALRSQNENYINFLIDSGANLEIHDANGRTPLLDNHAWHGECLGRILLQYGADLQVVDCKGRRVYDAMSMECLKKFVIPHAALLEEKGMIDQQFRRLVYSNSFVENYKECCGQIEGLKGCKLVENVRLFDLMIGKVERIAGEIRDESLLDVVRNYCRENQVLEYYSSTLEMKLERARVIYLSKKTLAMIMTGYTGSIVCFDHLVIEKIYGFLNYRDLRTLLF